MCYVAIGHMFFWATVEAVVVAKTVFLVIFSFLVISLDSLDMVLVAFFVVVSTANVVDIVVGAEGSTIDGQNHFDPSDLAM